MQRRNFVGVVICLVVFQTLFWKYFASRVERNEMYYQYLEYYWNNFNLERKENGSNDDREKALHEQQPVIFEGDQSSLLSNRYLISSRSSDSIRTRVLPKRIIVGRWVMAPEDYAFELFSLSIRLYFWPGSLLYDRHSKRSWKMRPSIHIFPAISRFGGKPTVDGEGKRGFRFRISRISVFSKIFVFDERKGKST